MNAFKANINESAKIISGKNEKDKEPTYKRRRHESIDSQESIPNKPKKSRKDSNSEGQKADSNLEEDREEVEEKTGDGNDQEKKDSNLEEDREEEEKTGDGDDQEEKDSNREEDREEDVEEKTGDGDDQEKNDSNREEDREEDLEAKTGDGDDHKHDDKEYIDEDNEMETENLDETAAEIDAVKRLTAKSSNDEDHDTSIN